MEIRRLVSWLCRNFPEEAKSLRICERCRLVHRLLNPLGFVAFKMGRLRGGRKERIWPIRRAVACSGHSTRFLTRPVSRVFAHLRRMACHEQATARRMDRYVTDEQRSSRPIFNATLRAAAGWLFFRVARSTVMIQIAALRSRLEKQPTDLRRNPRDLGDGAPRCRTQAGSLCYIAA